METQKLSPNGSIVTDVFDSAFLDKLVNFCDTFTPTHEWPAGDSPELPEPLPTAHREVFTLNHRESLYKEIIDYLNIRGKIINIELWRDYPGYRNLTHRDFDSIKDVMIIYLDGHGDVAMGTCFYDPERFIVPYIKNTGMLLFNSSIVEHGMVGEVSGVDYRRCLYINWLKDETDPQKR